MQSDGYEEEVEVGEILDKFPALRKYVLANFGGMKPREERVSSLELVTIHVDETKKTVNELFEYIVGFS